ELRRNRNRRLHRTDSPGYRWSDPSLPENRRADQPVSEVDSGNERSHDQADDERPVLVVNRANLVDDQVHWLFLRLNGDAVLSRTAPAPARGTRRGSPP